MIASVNAMSSEATTQAVKTMNSLQRDGRFKSWIVINDPWKPELTLLHLFRSLPDKGDKFSTEAKRQVSMQPAAGCIYSWPYRLCTPARWAGPGSSTSMSSEILFCTFSLYVQGFLFGVPVVVQQPPGFRHGLRSSRPRGLCLARPACDGGWS